MEQKLFFLALCQVLGRVPLEAATLLDIELFSCLVLKDLFLCMTNKPRASLFLFSWKNVKYGYENVQSYGYHMRYV